MSDYPIETIDLTSTNVGCKIQLRQCDVGWEYKTPYADDWQRANNREHALEYATEAAITQRTPAAILKAARLEIKL